MRVWGPRSMAGLVVAAVVFGLDRLNKLWFLDGIGIAQHEPLRVAPFLDLVLVWNRGVSYGLLQRDGVAWRLVLVAFALAVSAGLVIWLARARDRLTALALGAVIGGALGNVADRLIYGAVADFYHLHAFGMSWYVFNLADAAIVGGVAVLVYSSLVVGHKGAEKRR